VKKKTTINNNRRKNRRGDYYYVHIQQKRIREKGNDNQRNTFWSNQNHTPMPEGCRSTCQQREELCCHRQQLATIKWPSSVQQMERTTGISRPYSSSSFIPLGPSQLQPQV
jgi:hypothetical protein